MTKNIIVTGGSGMAGRWVVEDLLAHGHSVLNLDRTPLAGSPARTLITDLTDAGQVFDAFASTTVPQNHSGSLTPARIDAIVHFAAIPRIMIVPDNEVFRINVMSTYNVLDAASKYGIRKVVLASSETTYGICFANEDRLPEYLPLDEDYPVDPMDSYALSKIVNEATAKAFHARTGADLYCLRIGNVIEPSGYPALTATYGDPALRRRNLWSYIDARDLATAARLGVETDGLGYQVMNVAADNVSSSLTTAQLLERFYPSVRLTKPLGEVETLMSNEKIKRLLGFQPRIDWRDQNG